MAPRKVREYFDSRTGEYSMSKCFVLTNQHKYELAEFIKHNGNDSASVQEFIVRSWSIYVSGSRFDPNKYKSNKHRPILKIPYPMGSEILERLTSKFECPECQKEHPRGEGMSQDSVFKWRKAAAKQADRMGESELDYKEVDWTDALALTEAGIDFHFRAELKLIYDKVLMETKYGHETPYDSLDHLDLRYLQYFLQYYNFQGVTDYDLLCMMDMQKAFEEMGSPEQRQAFEDWLMFRPWEGEKELDKYRSAINSGGVAPLKNDKGEEVPGMLHLQFIRPSDCMQFNLPSQIIQYFLGENLNRYYPTRAVEIIGIDPWDEFTVKGSMDLDSEHNVRRQWEVENRIDRNERWVVLTDEVL